MGARGCVQREAVRRNDVRPRARGAPESATQIGCMTRRSCRPEQKVHEPHCVIFHAMIRLLLLLILQYEDNPTTRGQLRAKEIPENTISRCKAILGLAPLAQCAADERFEIYHIERPDRRKNSVPRHRNTGQTQREENVAPTKNMHKTPNSM